MKLTKRAMAVIAAFLVIACIGGAALFTSKPAAAEDLESDNLMQYARLQKEGLAVKEKLGEDTPYPDLYVMAEALVSLKGMDAEQAMGQAEERYTEKQALVWYAQKQGVRVTSEEVEKHIDALIRQAKGAENYDEVNEAYKAAGLTLEEQYRQNRIYYEKDYIISKFYEKWAEEFFKEEMASEESIDSAWQQTISQVTERYKASAEYKGLKPALLASRRIYEKGRGTDLKLLQKADIFVSEVVKD